MLRPVGSLAAAVLTIAASLLLTGAFHEDGIADTSDALGGAYDRAKLFVILKDSRVGTFGAAALVVSIGGRAALLAQIEANATAVHAAWCLPLVGAVARAAAVWQLAVLPYATAEGAKSGEIARAGVAQAIVATLIAASVVGALVFTHHLTPYRAAALLGVTALVTLVTAQRYMRRAGGVTGDFLGATEQLVELACLATLAWSAA